jgi:hypothetical protein
MGLPVLSTQTHPCDQSIIHRLLDVATLSSIPATIPIFAIEFLLAKFRIGGVLAGFPQSSVIY